MKLNKIFFLSLFISLLGLKKLDAQLIERSVIGNAGTTNIGSNAILSWNLGEPVIDAYFNSSTSLSQGFEQTVRQEFTGIDAVDATVGSSVYPNPTNGNITVSFSEEDFFFVEITDVLGRVRGLEKGRTNIKADLSGLAGGVYYITIKNIDGKTINTHAIQKVN